MFLAFDKVPLRFRRDVARGQEGVVQVIDVYGHKACTAMQVVSDYNYKPLSVCNFVIIQHKGQSGCGHFLGTYKLFTA